MFETPDNNQKLVTLEIIKKKQMELTKQLTNRLKEVFLEGKWVLGTNFKEQIDNLNWKDAIKNMDGLNSIAEITFHIHYYVSGVSKVLEGYPLEIKDQYSFDAPPIKSKEEWDQLVNLFCADSEKFIKLVENISEKQLFQEFVDPKYGNYLRNINVMIEHTYYHLGQIVLIKKLLKSKIHLSF